MIGPWDEKIPYPLVICYIANWKITMLLMGKLTISMAIFNSYVSLPKGISWDIPSGSLTVCELERSIIFKFGKPSINLWAIYFPWLCNK